MKSLRSFGKFLVVRLGMNPFATGVALWALTISVRAYISPISIAVTYVLPQLLFYGWSAILFFGGLFLLVGQLTRHSKISAAGCVLFAEGAFIYAGTIVWNPQLNGGLWVAVPPFIFGVAALVRLVHSIRGELLVWIHEEGKPSL